MASTPDVPLQSRIVDDKSPICIPFILERLQAHRAAQAAAAAVAAAAAGNNSEAGGAPQKPFIIGLNGIQGVGKTTLVKALAQTLQQREMLQTLVVSIDDFYLTHRDQLDLAAAHPDNALVQYRGEPGTHDIALARDFFSALCAGRPTHVPQYNKAAFSGLGDRVPESQWQAVNDPASGTPPVQVVILEGWSVGFRALPPREVEARWRGPSRTLHAHKVEHLLFVNGKLRDYDAVTDLFDAFIHVDAEDTQYVYDWRLQQEVALRRETGAGMTDEQVVKFVDAYYPAYELFSDGVRQGIFPDRKGCQLRLIVGKDRSVQDKIVI